MICGGQIGSSGWFFFLSEDYYYVQASGPHVPYVMDPKDAISSGVHMVDMQLKDCLGPHTLDLLLHQNPSFNRLKSVFVCLFGVCIGQKIIFFIYLNFKKKIIRILKKYN